MAVRNSVPGEIAQGSKADILAKLADIRGKLTFLMSLKGADIQTLVKVCNDNAPLLDKAQAAVAAYPDLVSRVLSREELRTNHKLSKDLSDIVDQINRLAESAQHTLTAVSSDKMVAALEVYAAKHHVDTNSRPKGESSGETEWIAGAIVSNGTH